MRVLRLLVRGLSYSGSAQGALCGAFNRKIPCHQYADKRPGLENKPASLPIAAQWRQSLGGRNWQRNKALQTAVQACIGRVTVKTVPCPSAGSAVTVPPCSRAISRTSASPRPTPPISRLLDLSIRKKLEHTCPILLRDAAACVCNTQHSAAFLLPDRDMHRPPGVLYLMPFSTKLKSRR